MKRNRRLEESEKGEKEEFSLILKLNRGTG
jgi:hypothetical protein